MPLPGPQLNGFFSEADELFYGGAAGGCKTELLLGLPILAHLESIIFRREFTQLTGATGLIEKSRKILGSTIARWNGQEYTWRDIPGGRSLEFGAVKHPRDWEKYAGRPHDFLGFDELPQFTEDQYRALSAWCRTETPGQRCRIVATGNPPATEEGRWVIKYWGPWLDDSHPNPAEPGELRWFAVIDDEDVEVEGPEPIEHGGETIQPRSRTFLPAGVEDNPYYMLTGYKSTLQGLPEPLRSQLLKGDFKAAIADDPWQVIPTEWVKLAQARWMPERPKDENGDSVPLSAIGCDPARGGRDATVNSERYDNWFAELDCHPGSTTPDGPAVATTVALLLVDEDDSTPIYIDITGIGSSPYDVLLAQGFRAIAVNSAEGTDARDKSGKLKLRNVRAEMWWKFREALDPHGGDDIALPPDEQLKADLIAPRWKLTIGGVLIEEKEQIKKRLKRSPDRGEAVLLASLQRAIVGDLMA